MEEHDKPKKTELTPEDIEKLGEILSTWDTSVRAVKFINVLGHIIKWFLGIGSALAIIYSVFHGGSPR